MDSSCCHCSRSHVDETAGQAKAAGMKILFATAEAYPFACTGGLAGVTGSLPVALERIGHSVSLIMPFYRDI
ncbi:MAG: glycogen/starch synthase, partial [Candidatus Fermentibacteraceae bacterium]|nr:glycogen/starch synthase [Candidatus Fermentibacteraceae bacterium]